jgi:hypothetical protein
MQMKFIALCALLLSCFAGEASAQTSANDAALTRDTSVHNAPDRERRLRINLDSAMILVEVTDVAATVELIAPCGTFVDPYASDTTLAHWADLAEVLPPPVPDSTSPDNHRYGAAALGGAKKGPLYNTTFKLVRLDSATSSRFLLRSTNTAWGCEVRLEPAQAAAFFGALRGQAAGGAIPYDWPSSGKGEKGRPDVSGAWVGPALDRQVEVKGSSIGLSYPKEFRGSGIAEKVRLGFIVDSTGKVRPSSVRLIGTPRPAFALSALRTLLTSEFRPAEREGRPVPTFEMQDFQF